MVWSSVERTVDRRICQFGSVLVLLLLLGTSVLAQPLRRPSNPFSPFSQRGRSSRFPGAVRGALIPARFTTVRDSKGFYWTINSDGSVRSSSSSWFRSAQFLLVNGVAFSGSSRMMTTGQEYVLSGSANGYQVRRMVKLVANEGYVRYIDSITNPHTTRRSINLELVTTLRYPPRAVLTDKAKSFVVGTGKKTTMGAVIVQTRSSYPTIIQYWGRGTKAANLSIQTISSSNLQYRWGFRIRLAPKQTWSLAHGIALRRTGGTPAVAQIRTMMQPFTARNFLAGVPTSVRRTIANGGGNFIEISASGGQLLKAVDEFAARWQIDRKADTLVVDDETMLKGHVKASNLKVVTRYGSADIPFAEVAMIRGGNGQGSIPRVYLRNGEVFVGDAELADATLQSTAGIPVKLTIDRLHTLMLARKPSDGKPTKEMKLLVQTQSGNRFAIRDKPAFELNAATAWGRVKVPMDRVVSLVMRRTPYPMQLVSFRDGSKLKTLLSGSEVKVGSLRFGEIPLTPITVASITRIAATKSKKVAAPHFQLVGDNLLVGTFADKALRIRTTDGIVVVKSPEIELIESDSGNLKVTTADKTSVVGTLVGDVVSISALGKTWKVPARHLVAFAKPEKKPAAKGSSAETKTANTNRRPASGSAGDAGVDPASSSQADRTTTPARRPPVRRRSAVPRPSVPSRP